MFDKTSLLLIGSALGVVILIWLFVPELVRRKRYPLVYRVRERLGIDLGGDFISIDGKQADSLSLAEMEALFSSKESGDTCVVKVYQLGDPGGNNHKSEYTLICQHDTKGVSFVQAPSFATPPRPA